MYQVLGARYSNEAEYVVMLSEGESAMGSALGRIGAADTEKYHRKAIDRLEQLLGLEPGNVGYRLERSMKQTQYSRTLLDKGAVHRALAASREALRGLEAVATTQSEVSSDAVRVRVLSEVMAPC